MNGLNKFLYNNKSKNNLEELLKLFSEDSFISFIGAGLSKPLGIGNWEELLNRLKKIVKDKFSIDIKFNKESKNWPQLMASYIYNIFNRYNSDSLFYDELIKGLQPQNCSWTSIHFKLIQIFKIFLTTNFDATIEKAFLDIEKRSPNKQCVPDFDPLELKKESIVYLHGNKTKRIFIFKKEEYDQFYPSVSKIQNGSTVLEDFLKILYRKKCFIFFGFSFKDYYLKKYFENLAYRVERDELINEQLYKSSEEGYRKKKYKHFLVISENTFNIIDGKNKYEEIEKICTGFESINIKPIIYQKDYHVFIENLLDYLLKEKKVEKPVVLERKEINGEI